MEKLMPLFAALLALFITVAADAQDRNQYAKSLMTGSGVSIQYPASYFVHVQDTREGRLFQPEGRQSEMIVSVHAASGSETIGRIALQISQRESQVTSLRKTASEVLAVGRTEVGYLFVQKTVLKKVSPSKAVVVTVRFEYPSVLKARYASFIPTVLKSLDVSRAR